MTRPLTQIHDVQTGQTTVREMNDAEFAQWQARVVEPAPIAPTKEQLLAQLQALQAQINALG